MNTDTPENPPGQTSFGPGRRAAAKRRREILKILEGSGRFLTPRQIHSVVAAKGQDIGLSTVYRALKEAENAGLLEVMRGATGRRYRLSPGTHEHRLECRECGKGVMFTSEALEEWLEALGRHHGFHDVQHAVSVTGTCHGCLSVHPRQPDDHFQ